jgi:signal peptidase
MKFKGRFDSTLVYILLGIALAFTFNQGLAFALSTDMPIVAVESNSMVPTFYKGDILILQGVRPQQISVGDIIVFSPPGRDTPVVHRVIQLNKDGTFQTKGDANAGQLPFETSIQPGQIHGKEVFIIPYVGWIKLGITDYIIPNILWVAVALLVIGAVVVVPKHLKPQKKHKHSKTFSKQLVSVGKR